VDESISSDIHHVLVQKIKFSSEWIRYKDQRVDETVHFANFNNLPPTSVVKRGISLEEADRKFQGLRSKLWKHKMVQMANPHIFLGDDFNGEDLVKTGSFWAINTENCVACSQIPGLKNVFVDYRICSTAEMYKNLLLTLNAMNGTKPNVSDSH